MKKIVLSAVAVLGLSQFSVAGGDIAPVAPVVEPTPMVGNFYAGAAYSLLTLDQTDAVDDNFDALMLQVGYKFNQYIALEGRYWHGFEETIVTDLRIQDLSVDIWGIYAKPMYPVTEELDIYGLLGYGSINYDTSNIAIDDQDGFSWGLGLAYSFTAFDEDFAVFADYVNIYQDDSNVNNLNSEDVIDTYNVGVTYKF